MSWYLKDLLTHKSFSVEDNTSLGRKEGTHLFPDLARMSRVHCTFQVEGENLYITDVGSTNGTLVDQQKIIAKEKRLLKRGAIIEIAGRKFQVEFGQKTESKYKIETSRTYLLTPTPVQQTPKEKMAPKNQSYPFEMDSTGLFSLILKNSVFMIFTLGLYIAHATTNIRKHLARSTKINDTSFVYHGDAWKLLEKYLIVLGGLLLYQMAETALMKVSPMTGIMLGTLSPLLLVPSVLAANYLGYAYIAQNTSYRSIRFKVEKKGRNKYIIQTILGSIFSLFTLGLYYPFMLLELHKIRWNNTSYGKTAFKLDVPKMTYAMNSYKGVIFSIFTFGLYWPWHSVKMHKLIFENLKLGPATFKSNAKGGAYCKVCSKGFLLTLFTLGLGGHLAKNMLLSYFINNLVVKGAIDFESLSKINHSGDKGSFGDAVSIVSGAEIDVA